VFAAKATKALVAVVRLAAGAAAAQDKYPTRPVRMIVPFPAGFASDFLARVVSQKLGELYGQQFIVDNRPGGGGIIGGGLISKAAPDGYTLGMVGQPHLMNPLMQKEAPYRPLEDITPVIEVAALPSTLVIAPSLQVKSISELIALAKSRPGQLNFASGGIGTSSHIAGELFRSAAGIDVVHVPFRVLGDAFTEMVAGRVHYYIIPLPAVMPMLKEGRLRPLAVGTLKRTPSLPDVPTISDSGLPGFQTDIWFGVVAPAKTPPTIVMKLNRDITAILGTAETRELFLRQGAEGTPGTPEEFQKRMHTEYVRLQKLVRDAGISAQ